MTRGPSIGRIDQAAVPFRLNEDWALITRAKLPVIAQPSKKLGDQCAAGLPARSASDPTRRSAIVALNSTAEPSKAIALLDETHCRHLTDPDLLFALVSMARDRENSPTRGRHARELVAPNLDDMQSRALLLDLEKTASLLARRRKFHTLNKTIIGVDGTLG